MKFNCPTGAALRLAENETLIVHSYRTIRWLIKNEGESNIMKSIQRKVRILQNRHDQDAEDIIDYLFIGYQERGHYRKYSPRKGALTTFMVHYVNNNLKNMLRIFDGRMKKAQQVHVQNNEVDRYTADEVLSYASRNSIFEPNNPEDYVLLKEVYEIMGQYFDEDDVEVLSGCVSMKAQAHRKGLNYVAYQMSLRRKKRALHMRLKETGW